MTRHLRIAAETALLASIIGALLVPYAMNGLWFDDSLNSQIWGFVNRFHSTVWEFSVRVTKAWLFGSGRILFCWQWIYGFFYAVKEPRLIRLADVSFVLAHLGCVVYLLRQVRVPWPTIGIFLLFLVSLFQIRDTHDPIAAYATFCQGLGIAITLALILLVKWRATGSVGYLVASVSIAMCSMLCYELNAIYMPICVIAIATSTHGKRLRSLAIVLVPFALFVAADLYVKHGATHPYVGSTFGTLSAIPSTYMKQLIAMLPGSFYLLRAQPDYPVSELVGDALGSKIAWAIAVLSLVSYVLLVKRQSDSSSGASRGLLVTAVAFVLLPPALIAISARYQTELVWGNAHLPVYYEYFGLALLGAVASARIFRGPRAAVLAIVAPIFAVYVASNWIVNMRQVASLDTFAEPRNSFVSALKAGLLDSVEDGDIVAITNQPVFINGNLIYQTIGKNLSIPNEEAISYWFESKPRRSANHYRLYRDPATGNAWRLSIEGSAFTH